MSDRSERVDRLIMEHASYNGQETRTTGGDGHLPVSRVTEIRRELVQIFQPEPDA